MSAVPRKRAKTSSVYECRACLMKIHDDSCCVDIFCAWDSSWPGMGASIAQDLIKLSNVQISATDPHSKNICKSCCSRLREALLFTSIVQKNDLFIRKRLRESSSESPMWPKPIQVDKNITANTLNAMTAEVKEEVLTDDEQEINESCSELIEPKLDIKIEPEEMTPAAIPSIEIEINCPLLHPGRDDQEVKTNGATEILDERLLAEVKEEPMSEDELEPAADMPKDCMLCLETFKTVKGLKAHVIAVHSYNTFTSPRAETVNVCTKCNRNFATPEELSTHKIGHSDFKCYICGKKFATFILLIKHKETCKPTSKLTRLETLEDVKSTIPVYYIIDRKLPQVKEKDPTPNSSKGLDSEVASTKEASSSVKELSVLGPLDSGKYKTKQENLPVEPSASRHLTDNDNPTVEKVTSTQNPILNQLSKTTLKKPDKVSSDDETNSIPNIKSEVLQAEEYTQKQQESVNIVKAVIADSESKQVTHKSEFKQESVETAHSNIMAIESKSNNDTEGSVQVQDNRSKVSNKKKENETEDDYKIKVNEPKVYKMEYIASEESISEVCNKTKGQRINTLETKLDVESQESNKMDDIRCQETNKPEDCNKTKGNVINTLETTLNEDSPESKTMDGVTSEDSNKTKECDITIPNEDEDSCASKENKKEETRRQSLVTCNNITTAPKQIDTEIKLNLSNEDSKPLLSKPQVENLETHSNPSEDSMEIQLEIQSIDEADAMDIDSDLRSEIKASSESDKHT